MIERSWQPLFGNTIPSDVHYPPFMPTPSDRDTFRNGLIPDLEQIQDVEPVDEKRDALAKARVRASALSWLLC